MALMGKLMTQCYVSVRACGGGKGRGISLAEGRTLACSVVVSGVLRPLLPLMTRGRAAI